MLSRSPPSKANRIGSRARQSAIDNIVCRVPRPNTFALIVSRARAWLQKDLVNDKILCDLFGSFITCCLRAMEYVELVLRRHAVLRPNTFLHFGFFKICSYVILKYHSNDKETWRREDKRFLVFIPAYVLKTQPTRRWSYQFNPELEAEFVKLVVGVSLDIQPVAIIDNNSTMCFSTKKIKPKRKQASKEIRCK